jgi:PAS domain S-box-containing protein
MTTITANIGDTDRLMSSVGVGMWTWDGRINKLQLDPTCKGFFELDWDEETPQTVLEEKLLPEDVELYRLAIIECVKTGKFACEFKVKKSSGSFRYLSGRGHTVRQDDDNHVIKGVFIDVTATKELEGRFRAHQSRMQKMVDGIPGMFSYINKDYKVLFMSAQYRDIFDKTTDQLVGVHVKELLGDEVFIERKSRYDEALAGNVVQLESSRLMKDGTTNYYAVTHQPHIQNGKVLGIITLGIDITESRKMQSYVEAKSEELQRSNRDLEQFAYVASHDLKSPLRAVEVIIEWLRDDLEDYKEGDVQENLDLLQQRAGRLSCLLDDLLAYSRAGRKVGDVRSIPLDEFVKDIAILIGPPEGMQIASGENMPTLNTHHAALETVLRNLISNAIKHHPDPANGHIEVNCEDMGEQVMISVTDDGPGIPEEYADKVFKMFQTLKPRDDTEGSGMGLAIVQRIIDWQGGDISFENIPDGKGITFKFTWNKTPQEMPSEDADEKESNEESNEPSGRADTAQAGGQESGIDHSVKNDQGHDTPMIEKDDEDERSNKTCEDIAG